MVNHGDRIQNLVSAADGGWPLAFAVVNIGDIREGYHAIISLLLENVLSLVQ